MIDLFLTNSPKRFYQTETFCTGLSDFHKLVLPIFKTTFTKSKGKEIIYQDFKNFNQQYFNNDFPTELSSKSNKSYGSVENIFLNTLYKHAPIKKKMLRVNHAPYITKAHRKAIIEKVIFKKPLFQNTNSRINKKDSLLSEELNLFLQNAAENFDINENSYITDETDEYTIQLRKPFTNKQTNQGFYQSKTTLEALLLFCLKKLL